MNVEPGQNNTEQSEFWVAVEDLPPEMQHLYPVGALVIMEGANIVEMANLTEKQAKSGIEIRQRFKLSYGEHMQIRDESNPRRKYYYSKIQDKENQCRREPMPDLGQFPPRNFFARLDSGEVVKFTASNELESETPPDRYPDYVFVGIGRFDSNDMEKLT